MPAAKPIATAFRRLSAALLVGLALLATPAAAEKVKIKHAGLTLNGKLELAGGKTLADGLILLLHGTLAHNDMDTIANLASTLNGRGHSTLAVNLGLGVDDRHGMYDCNATHKHKHLDALDELGAWFEWLKSKGAGKVVLLAHSRGGNQAARFAAERGHALLDRLVLMAPATWSADAQAAGFQRAHGKPLADVLKQADALVKAGKGAEVMAKVGILYCPGADVTAATFVSYYAPDPRMDTPSFLKEIKVPTLVVAASNDTVVVGLPDKVKPMADGKKLRLAVVDGADHFFLDLFAEDVADQVEKMLKGG